MKRTAFRVTALIALILAVSGNSRGQDHELTRETLRGLTGVAVVVESLNPELERDGRLTKDQLQTDVELKLRLAGIKVYTLSEREENVVPALYINANVMRSSEPIYAYALQVALDQSVVLERNFERAVATTWTSESVGLVGAAKLQQVRDQIKNHVDKFINAYLSVNPRQP